MKNILFVMHGLSDGGAEKVSSILANYLVESGYVVTFLCMTSKQVDYYVDPRIKLVFYESKPKTLFGRFFKKNMFVERVAKKSKPDIILSFLYYELVFSCLKRRSIVLSVRNDPANTDNSRIQKMARSFAMKRSRAIVFQTEGAKLFFPKKIQEKGVIIPNPLVISDEFKWQGFNCSTNFVTLCRLNKQKNLSLLIEAFSNIHSRFGEYRLLIYGSGEEKENLKKKISMLGLDDAVILMGRTKEPLRVLSNSFAFCLSSDYEGVSNAMLEACAIGVPCLCTDCPPGGAREYIVNGENGYLIEVGNRIEFEKRMAELIENKSLSGLEKHSEYVLKKHNCATVCSEWENVLLRACIKNSV